MKIEITLNSKDDDDLMDSTSEYAILSDCEIPGAIKISLYQSQEKTTSIILNIEELRRAIGKVKI